jgi:CheY-like chemotaxis protein
VATRRGRVPAPAETLRPPAHTSIDVLVVDDSDLTRASMVRALKRAGLSVAALASAIGVTRAVLRNTPPVILIDLDMPAMRGDRLIGALRQRADLHHVKLVLMSGHEAASLRTIARENGADAVAAKAEGWPAIVRTVEALLDPRNR